MDEGQDATEGTENTGAEEVKTETPAKPEPNVDTPKSDDKKDEKSEKSEDKKDEKGDSQEDEASKSKIDDETFNEEVDRRFANGQAAKFRVQLREAQAEVETLKAELETTRMRVDIQQEFGLTSKQMKFITGKTVQELKDAAKEFVELVGGSTGSVPTRLSTVSGDAVPTGAQPSLDEIGKNVYGK